MAYEWIGPAIQAGTALFSAYSANKASDAQSDAASAAAGRSEALTERAYNDSFPYRDLGQNALYQLGAGLGTEYAGAPGTVEDRSKTALNRFQTSPGYQFQFGQGIQAIERGASARGLLDSGATAKALQRFGTGLAAQDYGNYQNRLAALAGIGQTAVVNSGNQGIQGAGQAGQFQQAAGVAQGSGYAGVANQVTNGLENLATSFNQYQTQNQNQNQSQPQNLNLPQYPAGYS